MSNNNAINKIECPKIGDVDYSNGISSAFDTINNNFSILANHEFVKGEAGKSASFYIVKLEPNTKDPIYTELKEYIETLLVEEETDDFLNNFTGEFIVIKDENGNPISSLEYVFLDGRFWKKDIGIENKTYFSDITDKSCVIKLEQTKDGYGFKSYNNSLATMYYDENLGLCWKVNGQETGLPIQGIPGKDGSNAKLEIVIAEYNTDTSEYDITEILVNKKYVKIEKITSTDKEKYINSTALVIVPSTEDDIINEVFFGSISISTDDANKLIANINTKYNINDIVKKTDIVNSFKHIRINNSMGENLPGLFIPMNIVSEDEYDELNAHLITAINTTTGSNGYLNNLLICPVEDINDINTGIDIEKSINPNIPNGCNSKMIINYDVEVVSSKKSDDAEDTYGGSLTVESLTTKSLTADDIYRKYKNSDDTLSSIKVLGEMIEITYEDLVTLRDNNWLIPGQQYRIIDYVTTTSQENTKTAGHQFDIIVTADSESVLNEKARAIQHEGDTYFANSNLAAWEIWYCLDNDEERFSWTSNDPNKLDEVFKVEYTDNNNVTHITTTSTKKEYVKNVSGEDINIDKYYPNGDGGGKPIGPVIETYSPLEFEKTKLINNSKFYTYSNGTHFENAINDYTDQQKNVFYTGDYYIVVDTSQSYELLLSPECEKTAENYVIEANKPVKWYNVYKCKYSSGSITDRTICHIFVPDTYKELLENSKSFQILSYGGIVELGDYVFNKAYNIYNKNGVIYRMIDEFGNDCPYDFKNIQFARWKITSYKKYFVPPSSLPVEVTDGSKRYITLLKEHLHGLDENPTISFVKPTSLGYDSGYYVDYTTSSTPNYCYTFGYGNDYSLNGNCNNNVIKEYKSDNILKLNNIVFLNKNCFSNTFGIDCCNNTFDNNCFSNTFGNRCLQNVFEHDCFNNTFGNDCCYNCFDYNCRNNTFGNDCQINRFETKSEGNTFGNMCQVITFNKMCTYNTFGNMCQVITFNKMCTYNTFGNDNKYIDLDECCEDNVFGNGCYDFNVGSESNYNTIGSGYTENITGGSNRKQYW